MIVSFDDFPGDNVPLPEQLHDGAEALRSRISSLAVERVVIRRADFSQGAGNREGTKLRLLLEGALTSAARSVVIDTRIGTGKDTGAWFGSNKAGVDQAATSLLAAAGLPARYRDAASAALAGLALSP
jgi:hypothetical protein